MNYLRKVAGFRTVPIEPSRVGLNLCQDGAGCRESVLRCYRREVYSMSMERELPVTSGSSLEFTGVDLYIMKECIQNELPHTVRMYYRKDGTSFWLHISPVRNASGKVKKLEIGALVFISGVVRVKILKFEQARTLHGNYPTWLLTDFSI
ncbi:protein TWIN LOV 1 isoform X3 [Capsicum chacoense]